MKDLFNFLSRLALLAIVAMGAYYVLMPSTKPPSQEEARPMNPVPVIEKVPETEQKPSPPVVPAPAQASTESKAGEGSAPAEQTAKLESPPTPVQEDPAAKEPTVETPPAKEEPLSPELAAAKAKADDLIARGKFREAYTAYETLDKMKPREDTAVYTAFQMGMCRYQEKRYQDAFSLWSKLRQFHADAFYAPQSLRLEAEAPGNAGKLTKLQDEILSRYPTSVETASILEKRGQAAFDRKDYKAASENWKLFTEIFPKHAHAVEVQKKLETVELVFGGDKQAGGDLESEDIVRRADALFDRAEFAEAARLYDGVLKKFSLSKEGGHAAGRLAQCLQGLGKDKEALDVLQRMVEKNPEEAPNALGEIVVQATNSRMDGLRQRATQQLLDKYPATFEAQQALFIAGSVAMSRKNRTEAQKQWNTLLEKYPQTDFRQAVENALGMAKDEPVEVPKTASQLAHEQKEAKKAQEKQLVEDRKRWEQEAWGFEKVYRNADAAPEERAEAAFEWAERCFSLGQYEKAAQQYQRVWEEFPQSEYSSQAAFNVAQVWFNAGQPQKGNEQLLFVINRFPSSQLCAHALFCLGNRSILYEANSDKAWTYYDRLMKEFPDSSLTSDAREFWAEISKLAKQDLKEQSDHFMQQEKLSARKHS